MNYQQSTTSLQEERVRRTAQLRKLFDFSNTKYDISRQKLKMNNPAISSESQKLYAASS